MAKKSRQSNMELLRIIAMFLVLLVHANFYSLGVPSVVDCESNTLDAVLRVYFQAVSIICVNLFVGISGWFGICPTAKGMGNFIFQCMFWIVGLYILTLYTGTSDFSVNGLKECLFLTDTNWFIKAYMLLYILSPVLNTFAENASRRVFCNVLIGFFVFQTIYGWMFPQATPYITNGYSPISFIGLYLLMRYIRAYRPNITQHSKNIDLMYIIIVPICVTVCYILPPIAGIRTVALGWYWLSYIAPSSIGLTIAVILFFSKVRLQSKFINWVAASSFAVFLLHYNTNTIHHYTGCIRYLYSHYNPVCFWSMTFVLMIGIFIISIIIDQIRIKLWNTFRNICDF